MTTLRRTLLLGLAVAGSTLTLCGVAVAAAPAIQTAPGRVVIPVGGGAVDLGADNAGGASDPAVALPDGGAVAIYAGQEGQSELVQITSDGALDPSFGTDGVVDVEAILPTFTAGEIIRQPDGKLVVVGSQRGSSAVPFPPVVLIRFDPDGSLDHSFGTGGVDTTPVQESCDCSTVGLQPDGGFVVGGATTQQAGPTLSGVKTAITQWTVAGLTANGALDPSFGQNGLITLVGNGASGIDLQVLPDGDIVTTGDASVNYAHYQGELTRLLPTGAPDPSFHGGTPETLPSTPIPGQLLAYPDGTVIVGVTHAIIRYTTAGLPDQSFGAGGIVQTGPATDLSDGGQLLPAAGDGALVIEETGPEYAEGRYTAQLIGPTGALDPSLGGPTGLAFSVPFGGGSSNLLATIRPQSLAPLDQNAFAGYVVQRPDGSYLLLGGVTVSQPTGEGTGNSIADFAAAALTASFKVDPSFGGPVTPLRGTLTVLNQRAATARARHGIRVTLRFSAPGLARVVIRGGGGVVAQSVLPVLVAGRKILPVELTSFGAKWLKTNPRGRLNVSLAARDLLANPASDFTEVNLH
jgi:uncharacterized delta-60 repeat protein